MAGVHSLQVNFNVDKQIGARDSNRLPRRTLYVKMRKNYFSKSHLLIIYTTSYDNMYNSGDTAIHMFKDKLGLYQTSYISKYLLRTLRNLHEIHVRNSYVLIICANSCQKLTKSKIGSS